MLWLQTGATYYHSQLGVPGNHRLDCLLCSVVRGWVLEQAQNMGLVPFCGQDGYQAQLLHYLIETQKNNLSINPSIYLSKYL